MELPLALVVLLIKPKSDPLYLALKFSTKWQGGLVCSKCVQIKAIDDFLLPEWLFVAKIDVHFCDSNEYAYANQFSYRNQYHHYQHQQQHRIIWMNKWMKGTLSHWDTTYVQCFAVAAAAAVAVTFRRSNLCWIIINIWNHLFKWNLQTYFTTFGRYVWSMQPKSEKSRILT